MLRFSILPRAVVALAAIRSTATTRPVLNGVHLAPDGTMTATDGHCLLTWRAAALYADADADSTTAAGAIAAMDENTLPAEGLVLEITPALLRLAKLKKCARLALEITADVAKWTPTTANGFRDESSATLARVLHGPYPNYRQVIPRDVPEVTGALPPINAEYVGRFAAVTTDDYHNITLTPTGSASPVLVTFARVPDAFGIIMPLRDGAAHEIPAWVHPITPAAPEETAAPSPDCPAAEHDDTNAECTCSHSMRITAVA